MSLALASFLLGSVLFLTGLLLLRSHAGVFQLLRTFPRSRTAAWILFGTGAVWFLYRVLHLSPADFGDHRLILFALFLSGAVLAFHYVPDFLAVRGLAILGLLIAGHLLEAAFLKEPGSRLFLVSAVYGLLIVPSIYFGAAPYRFRDLVASLERSALVRGLGGSFLLGYGVLLLGLGLVYLFSPS
jgi:hypothetical protein